jgi:hypothetical protein
MNEFEDIPMEHRQRLHRLLIDKLYSHRILNNSHRGDFVEMMVLDALGPEWRHVGLGWNVWDLQRGTGKDRARIQVKQCAARQLWGKTRCMTFQFPWSDRATAYIARDFPHEAIEKEGWFCELFVVGVHAVEDEVLCDQTDPSQWEFMVVASRELKHGRSSMTLRKALKRWPVVPLAGLKSMVEKRLDELREKETVTVEAPRLPDG